ncbi:MAG: 8-oxo-dGTP diphosphatase [Elusimicrobia bacterium]|nr:8-oxo-dGTP diphosphatase [Elusimicrobiota bacterium]
MSKRIQATLCYLKKDGETLMLHRVKKKNDIHEGRWNGLGGKIEDGETPEECVAREVKEESGLKIKNPILKGIINFPGFDDENDWMVFLYTVSQFSGELTDCKEGHLYWIPDHDLTSLRLWEGDKIFLKWLKQKRFFTAKFIYKKGEYKSHQVIFYPKDN